MAADISATILVIDDEPSIVRVLAQLLRRDGYRVETAANGQHALTQLHTQPYDVIVSDLHMPDLDGRAFYTLLQHQYPALCQRVIFLTGNGDAADSATFLAQCGQPWLPKPCPIAVLRRTIQQVLAAAVVCAGQARRPRPESAAVPHEPDLAPTESMPAGESAGLAGHECALADERGPPEELVSVAGVPRPPEGLLNPEGVWECEAYDPQPPTALA